MKEVKLTIRVDNNGNIAVNQFARNTKDKFDDIADAAKRSSRSAERSSNRFIRSFRKVASSKLFLSIRNSLSGLGNGFAKMYHRGERNLAMLAAAAKRYSAIIVAAMTIAATAGVGFFTKSVIDASVEMERYETQFTTFYGGLENARKKLETVTKFAETTPYELPEVIRATRSLKVLTQGALDNAEGLTLVGDAAAAVGVKIDELTIWFGRLYGALKSGRAMGMAMRRLTDLGVISDQVRTKLENMRDAGATGEEVWEEFTRSAGRFRGMMIRLSKTVEGMVSNISDIFFKFRFMVGKKVFDAVRADLQRFLDWLDDAFKTGTIERYADKIGSVMAGAYQILKRAAKGALSVIGAIYNHIKENTDIYKNIMFVVGAWTAMQVAVRGVEIAIVLLTKRLGIIITIAVLASKIWKNYNIEITNGFNTMANRIAEIRDYLIGIFETPMKLLSNAINNAIAFVKTLTEVFSKAWDWFQRMSRFDFSYLSEVNTLPGDTLKNLQENLKEDYVGDLFTEVKDRVSLAIFAADMGLQDLSGSLKEMWENTKAELKSYFKLPEIEQPKLPKIEGTAGAKTDSSARDRAGADKEEDKHKWDLAYWMEMKRAAEEGGAGAADELIEAWNNISRIIESGMIKATDVVRLGFEHALFTAESFETKMFEMGENIRDSLYDSFNNGFNAILNEAGSTVSKLQNLFNNSIESFALSFQSTIIEGVSADLSETVTGFVKDLDRQQKAIAYAASSMIAASSRPGGIRGSDIGGAAGFVAGSYLPFPGGEMVGGLVGSLLGGLFDSGDQEKRQKEQTKILKKIEDNTRQSKTQLQILNNNMSRMRTDMNDLYKILPERGLYKEGGLDEFAFSLETVSQ
jgi:phage tail tape-measure protein